MLPVYIIDQVRTFKKMSVRELARVSGVNQAHLSGWFREIPGRLSPGKIHRVLEVLGLDPSGFPLPGVHRFEPSSMAVSEMDRIEGTVRTLVPGGVTVVHLQPETSERWTHYIYVLIPNRRPEVRIVLLIPPMLFKDRLAPPRGLDLRGLGAGSKWPDGSISEENLANSVVTISSDQFERIQSWQESLTVPDLDFILGIPKGDSDWTWKTVTAALESRGIGPEETARKMGLVQ